MVLFTMEHIGCLSQILTFRYTRHKDEEAVLIVNALYKNSEFVTKMNKTIFSSIAFFYDKFRADHLKEKTWEEQICRDYQAIFDNLGMNLRDFSEIYCTFDISNDFYIYCHLNEVQVNFVEFVKGQFDDVGRYKIHTILGRGDPTHEEVIRKYDTLSGEKSAYVKRRYVFEKKLDKDVQLNLIDEFYKVDDTSRTVISEAIEVDKIQMGKDVSLFCFNSSGFIVPRAKENAYVVNAIIADTYLRHIHDLYLKDHPQNVQSSKCAQAKLLLDRAATLPMNIPLELIVLAKRCRLRRMISVLSTSNEKVAGHVDENIVLENEAYLYWRLLIRLMVAYEIKTYLGGEFREHFHGLSRVFLMNYRKAIEEPFEEGWPKGINPSVLKGKIFTVLGHIKESEETEIEHALANADEDSIAAFLNTDKQYRFVPYEEVLLKNFLIVRIEKKPEQDNIYPDLQDEFLYVFVKNNSIKEKLQQFKFNQNMKYSGFNIHAEIMSDIKDLEIRNERKKRVRAERWLKQLKEVSNEKDKLELELKKLSGQLENERKEAKRVLLESISRHQAEQKWEQRFYHCLQFLHGKSLYPGYPAEGYAYLCALLDALNANPVKNILEFGCSASTSLAGQHAGMVKGQHLVLEYDRNLAEFILSQNRQAFSATTVRGGELTVQDFDGDAFYSYAATKVVNPAAKFGLFLIKHPEGKPDKPPGDILSFLPRCLEKEFIILLPYSHMEADRKLLEKIESCLNGSGVAFEKCVYGGEVCILSSPGQKQRFHSDMNLLQINMGRAECCAARSLTQRRKRILYTFYHGGAFGWCLIHRLTIHRDDEAYLLLADDLRWSPGHQQYRHTVEKFLEKGIFQGLYTYSIFLGQNGKSLSETDNAIRQGLDEELQRQECQLESFDMIYSGTDNIDTMGSYLDMKGIHFTWFELAPNVLTYKNEQTIRRDYANKIGYRDSLLKHGTMYGKSPCQSYLMYPDSKATDFPKEKISYFDPNPMAKTLNQQDKADILNAFALDNMPQQNHVAWVFVQSGFWSQVLYRRVGMIREKYKGWLSYYYFFIQLMMDYYVPEGARILLKPHPSNVIDNQAREKYFMGVFAYDSLFTVPLLNILPREQRPEYAVLLGSSAPRQLGDDIKKISCESVMHLATFYNKYYITLAVLNHLGLIYKEAGEKFLEVESDVYNFSHYSKNVLPADINTMIAQLFPNAQENCSIDFHVRQTGVEHIYEEVMQYDFVIFVDAMEEMTKDILQVLSRELSVGIIMICKNPCKLPEDLLVPLEDEHIFFFSRNDFLLRNLDTFIVSRKNNAMGIELAAGLIGIDEYEHGGA